MPRIDGLELARRLAVTAPQTAVLVYSGVADVGLVQEALDAGARGFMLKDAPLSELASAIDTVAAGNVYVDPTLAATLLSSRLHHASNALSPREREVLCELAHGRSYVEIGSALFLSPETVRSHAQRGMTKLGARTRTEAVAIALRDGLIA